MDYGRPELADRLAAAYASGTLRGAARRRLVALLPAHAALRAAVRAWEDRLMPLTAVIAPVAPPPALWRRIEARLHGMPSAPGVDLQRGLWSGLAFWRGLAGVASLAALVLAVLLATPGPALPPVVVVLSAAAPEAGGAAASFVASISGDGRSMVTRPLMNVKLAADRALELWALPAAGAPRSLGVISASGTTVVTRGQALRGATGLAVTLEPPGGSPSGAPTGPTLYVGKLTL